MLYFEINIEESFQMSPTLSHNTLRATDEHHSSDDDVIVVDEVNIIIVRGRESVAMKDYDNEFLLLRTCLMSNVDKIKFIIKL